MVILRTIKNCWKKKKKDWEWKKVTWNVTIQRQLLLTLFNLSGIYTQTGGRSSSPLVLLPVLQGLFLFLSFSWSTLKQVQRFKSQFKFKTERYSCMLAGLGYPPPEIWQERDGGEKDQSGAGDEEGLCPGRPVQELGVACQNPVQSQSWIWTLPLHWSLSTIVLQQS